ncbi:MAG TPA: PhzF family phenazine biosynthesis protein [Rhizomicrobium sp.]|nr:PhzF family phenazine biosynthesis protein [Rhizomicrobium sp.]
MKLDLWQVDAFAAKPLEGNPAALVPLNAWLPDDLMQKIANENNLAETAFFLRTRPTHFDLRWFTPESEVDLCGHATLASAWLVFAELAPELKSVSFETRSGTLKVDRGSDGRHIMSMPSEMPLARDDVDRLGREIAQALGTSAPAEVLSSRYVVAVWNDARDVRAIRDCGDIARVLRKTGIWGLVVTAPGDDGYDFVSRFFAPDKGVPEDPVTGSAHCALTPYWAKRLGKKTLKARQVSPRGGDLVCTDDGGRAILSGPCALYMKGEIHV